MISCKPNLTNVVFVLNLRAAPTAKEVPARIRVSCQIWWPCAWRPFSAFTTSDASVCTEAGGIWRPAQTLATRVVALRVNLKRPPQSTTSRRITLIPDLALNQTDRPGTCSATWISSTQCESTVRGLVAYLNGHKTHLYDTIFSQKIISSLLCGC